MSKELMKRTQESLDSWRTGKSIEATRDNTDPVVYGSLVYPIAFTEVIATYRTESFLRLIPRYEIPDGTVLYSFYEGSIEGAPTMSAEDTEKAQMSFTQLGVKSVTPLTASVFIKLSNELVENAPLYFEIIKNQLLYRLQVAIDQGLWDVFSNSGAQDTDTSIPGAVSSVIANCGRKPDGIIINPIDYMNLLENDPLVYGEIFGRENSLGLDAVVTPEIPQGSCLVGNFKLGSAFFERVGPRLDITNSNDNDFLYNLSTTRAESHFFMQVLNGNCFAFASLS